MSQNYLEVFEAYQSLLGNFAKVFKQICNPKKEESYFFDIANYFLDVFPHEITIEEAFINKIYANILSFGDILENRILRAFEKSKVLCKLKDIPLDDSEEKKKADSCNTIHIGKLSFMVARSSFELNEYEDLSEQKTEYGLYEPKEPEVDYSDALKIRKSVSENKISCKLKDISKLSDNLSVLSASTSENLKAKRRHRKRRRRTKRKNLKQTPEDHLSHSNSWNFENWVYGNEFK